jgi:hypothetical protein
MPPKPRANSSSMAMLQRSLPSATTPLGSAPSCSRTGSKKRSSRRWMPARLFVRMSDRGEGRLESAAQLLVCERFGQVGEWAACEEASVSGERAYADDRECRIVFACDLGLLQSRLGGGIEQEEIGGRRDRRAAVQHDRRVSALLEQRDEQSSDLWICFAEEDACHLLGRSLCRASRKCGCRSVCDPPQLSRRRST